MKPTIFPLLASLMFAAGAAAAEQCAAAPAPANPDGPREVRYRKNIDDLTPAELEAFKHAVAELKRKSHENVYDRTGFLWQAWVHNCTSVNVFNDRAAALPAERMKMLLGDATRNSCDVAYFLDKVPTETNAHIEFPGECEHQKNTFLQWHRAQLYFYEQALQAADPEGRRGPSTRNVALPYWNFSRKPSGARYPKAFEDQNSPLFDSTRTSTILDSSLATASPYLLAYQIYYMDWPDFGGDEHGTRGGGALETKIHNRMHATYIGGNMGDNITAGLDPIFYVFHNFLDYSFEKWLEEHGDAGITGSGRDSSMRAEQDAGLPKPIGWAEGDGDKPRSKWGSYTANMGQAGIYFDTIRQGYGYQPHYGGEFIRKQDVQALIDQHQQAGFVFGDNEKSLFAALLSDDAADGTASKPDVVLTAAYKIPAKAIAKPKKANMHLDRSNAGQDYSFQADVYLYPAEVPAQIGNRKFRDRYLVTTTSHWALSGHHAHPQYSIDVDVTGIINSLVARKRGKTWQITTAVTTNDKGRPVIKKSDFSGLAIKVVSP